MNGLSHLWMVYNLFFYGYYGYYGQWLLWFYTFCPGRCSSQFVRRCGSPLRPRRPSCVCTCTCCDHKKGLRTKRVQPVTGERQQKISNQYIYIYILYYIILYYIIIYYIILYFIILYYIYILHIPLQLLSQTCLFWATSHPGDPVRPRTTSGSESRSWVAELPGLRGFMVMK